MPANRDYDFYETDVLVVGSEGGGGRAAIGICDEGLRVIVATKGRLGRTGATVTAGADLTVDGKSAKEYCGLPGDERDSPESFFDDIIREGFYLNNQKLVEAYVEGAPIVLKELIEWGMKIFYYESAHFQEMARGAITSGPSIMRALRKAVRKRGIRILEDIMVLDLLTQDKRIVGAIGLNMNTGGMVVIKARAVILATGGWQRVWSLTSAPHELTGDGQAIAYRAGAEMIDMEMIQSTPGNIISPPRFRSYSSLYRLSTKIDAGKMINSQGERFMEKYDPERLEHSSKEVLSLGIMTEVLEGRGTPEGGVWWSFKDVDKTLIEETVKRHAGKGAFFFETGLDDLWRRLVEKGMFEVGVAAHFMIGGIRVNQRGETNLPGLYAAGECSSNLWGATRVASACSQVCIQGMCAAKAAAEFAKESSDGKIDKHQIAAIQGRAYSYLDREKGYFPVEVRKRIQRIADEQVNVVRNGEKLQAALHQIEKIREEISEVAVQGSKTKRANREWIEALQLENLRQCLELTTVSALHRKESRGAHYRTDFPMCDNDQWLENTVIHQEAGRRIVRSEPLVTTKIQPPGGKMAYLEMLGVGLASIKGKQEKTL